VDKNRKLSTEDAMHYILLLDKFVFNTALLVLILVPCTVVVCMMSIIAPGLFLILNPDNIRI